MHAQTPDISEARIASHYHKDGLFEAILQSLKQSGIDQPNRQSLAAVDEFHVGGSEATAMVAAQLPPQSVLLDIGCGLGGAARFVAHALACHVAGIDLSESYVSAGNQLTRLVGMADQVNLETGNALNLAFDNAMFDGAYMMHVGMNISSKEQLMRQAYRVIKPGGRLVIYDTMRVTGAAVDAAPPKYPLPWAENADDCAVGSHEDYALSLTNAGFEIVSHEEYSDFAIDFMDRVIANRVKNGPSPLGLHLLMGASAAQKSKNLHAALKKKQLAPVVMVASRV